MKRSRILHHQSRAAFMIIGTTVLCSSIVAFLILFFVLSSAKKELLAETQSFAQILSANLTPSLAFDDQNYAHEVLSSLKLHHSIAHVCIYRKDGSLFAQSVENDVIDCPSPTLTQTIANQIIRVPIIQKDAQLGSLSVYVSNERLNSFRNHIILPSVGIILGFMLLVAAPISALVQRRISKPINQLVANAQSLMPGRHQDMDSMRAALQIVELAKQRLVEFSETNKWSDYKVNCMMKNFQLSLTLIKDQFRTNYDIATTNEAITSHPQFSITTAGDLFAVSRNEIERSQEYLKQLDYLLASHQKYIASPPQIARVDDLISKAYNEYFGNFLGSKIILKNTLVIDQPIKFFADEFQSFIYSYFIFCDLLTKEAKQSIISLTYRHADEQEKRLLCSLELQSDSILLLVSPEEYDGENLNEQDILTMIEFEDKIKSVVEKMVFFSNLNSQHESALSMKINPRSVLVNFYIDEQ